MKQLKRVNENKQAMTKVECEVPAAHKTILLIELLGRESRAMKLSEIADKLKCNVTMVHRLLRVLESDGWVKRVGAKGPYQLTTHPLQCIISASGTNNLVTVATPYLRRLAEKTNCIAVISLPGIKAANCLTFVQQSGAVGVATRIGCDYPYHASGPGKLLMAYSDEVSFDRVVEAGLPRFTDNTLTTPKALQQELDRIRREGYAVDNEEGYRGIICINVPLFNFQQRCIATLGISTLGFYQTIDEYVSTCLNSVLQCGRRISGQLGCENDSEGTYGWFANLETHGSLDKEK